MRHASSLGLLVLLLAYVTAFWGRAGLLLPPPLDDWHFLPFRALTHLSEGAQLLLRGADRVSLYVGAEAFLLGLILPAALLRLALRRAPADLGLCAPDAAGWRWTLVGAALSVPVGLWITALVPPTGSDLGYLVGTLGMIPEHFLIFGVGIALLLPERRLRRIPSECVGRPPPAPPPPQPSPIKGEKVSSRPLRRAPPPPLWGRVGVGGLKPNRSFGFRMTCPPGPVAGLGASLGLTPETLLAVFGSAALFVAAHVGARPAELAFSLLAGLAFATMTWRTASIWPALLVHWSLNLAPLGLRALFP